MGEPRGKSDGSVGPLGREDDMGVGEEITAARDAWRDAKRAYDDEAARMSG